MTGHFRPTHTVIQHDLERNRPGEYYTRGALDYLGAIGFEINEVRTTRRGWVECARKPVRSSPASFKPSCLRILC
jgi:hypothetical protein